MVIMKVVMLGTWLVLNEQGMSGAGSWAEYQEIDNCIEPHI